MNHRALLSRIKSEVTLKLPARSFPPWSSRPKTISYNDKEIPIVCLTTEEFSTIYNGIEPAKRQFSSHLLDCFGPNLVYDNMAFIMYVHAAGPVIKSAVGSNPYKAARNLAWASYVRKHPDLDLVFRLKFAKKLFNFSWWIFYKFNSWTLPVAPKIDDVYDRKVYVGDGPMGELWNGVSLIPKSPSKPILKIDKIQ
jgi:hypothetical protein